jgi:hypothetical protein
MLPAVLGSILKGKYSAKLRTLEFSAAKIIGAKVVNVLRLLQA